MNDTVVAAIIGAVGVVLAAVIGLLAQRRKTQHQSHALTEEISVTSASIPNASHGVTRPAFRRTTDLSHKQIANAIEAVPPLQREGVEASFVGVCVVWRGKLFSALRQRDHVFVSFECVGEMSLFHCTAAHEDCVDLLIIPAGTELIVRGRIKGISISGASLEDCKFDLPKTLQPSVVQELQTKVSELESKMNATPAEQFAEKVRRATEDSKREQPNK